MGININGYIEVSWAGLLEIDDNIEWTAVVNLGEILPTRDYFMYHSLFGIRDDTDFEPIAPDRGLPADASELVLEAYEDSLRRGHGGHTWVTFQELQAVDWEETKLAGVAWEYKDGQETGRGKGYFADDPRRVKGADYEEDGSVWKFQHITRHESLGEGGPLLYELMEALARQFGAEYVRATVWFG